MEYGRKSLSLSLYITHTQRVHTIVQIFSIHFWNNDNNKMNSNFCHMHKVMHMTMVLYQAHLKITASVRSPSSLLDYSTHYCSGSFLSHWAAQRQGSITFNLISPAALALAPLAGIVSTFRTVAHTITDCFQIGRNIIRVLEWQRERREKEGCEGHIRALLVSFEICR